MRLVVLESPFRSLMEPLLEYIEQVERERTNAYITVVLPEFVPSQWWHHLLHNQRALLIKGALLFRPSVVTTSVPFHLSNRGGFGIPKAQAPLELDLNSDLDDAFRRDAEEGRRAHGVLRHEREQAFAPERHPRALGRQQRLDAQEERRASGSIGQPAS